jgi:hypothetical protein
MTFTIDEYVYMAVSVIKSEEETRGCDETTQIYIFIVHTDDICLKQ